MYNHVITKLKIPKLDELKIDGNRYYKIDNELYPSVTTILSIKRSDGLKKWRERLGEDVANFEVRRAINRGNGFHKICEDYLNNKNIIIHKKNILSYGMFNLVKKEFERIDNIHGLETTLYSKSYKIAGRADCIAEFDGLVSILDFKSANRAKTAEILENHSIQETAYAIMWEELTKTPIEQIVTIVACENGETQINIEKPKYFQKKLVLLIEAFRNHEKMKIESNEKA